MEIRGGQNGWPSASVNFWKWQNLQVFGSKKVLIMVGSVETKPYYFNKYKVDKIHYQTPPDNSSSVYFLINRWMQL